MIFPNIFPSMDGGCRCDILQRKTMHELATAGIPEDDQALSDLKDIVEVTNGSSQPTE